MEVKALKCLDAQIQEKRNRRNEELVRSRALAESLKMETELYNKQQKEKAKELKNRNKKWYGDIYQQIAEIKEGKKKRE